MRKRIAGHGRPLIAALGVTILLLPILTAANFLVIASLGVLYLESLRFILVETSVLLRNHESLAAYQKMMLTVGSALVATILIFALNRWVTRQQPLFVGIASSVVAFLGYYVLSDDPAGFLGLMFAVVTTSYSLVALLAFIGLPLACGWWLRHSPRMSGLLWLREVKVSDA